MRINTPPKAIIWLILMAIGLMLVACSPSAEKLNQQGNQAFLEEAYQEALQAYQSAQIESPELAEPYYNAANSLYRQGNYAEALAQLQHALNFAKEPALAQSGFYNTGNNLFNTQDWQTAIEAYKQALLLNPDDQEAKYNLELALQQMQSQEQQQEQQEEQQEENQDQDSQGEQQDQQEQDSQGSENGEEGQKEQEQNSQQSDSGENQEEGDQSQDPQESEDQQEGSQDQDQGQGQPQPDDQQQNTDGQPGQMPPAGQRMTEEQAKQLLAAIAKDMDTLQERMGEIMFVRELPPLQDW